MEIPFKLYAILQDHGTLHGPHRLTLNVTGVVSGHPQSLLGPGTRAAALPWLLMSTVSLLQTRVKPAGELYPLTGCSVPSPALIHAVLSVRDSVKLKPMHQGFCQFNMLSNVPISSK